MYRAITPHVLPRESTVWVRRFSDGGIARFSFPTV
jgi:hypothetical protein